MRKQKLLILFFMVAFAVLVYHGPAAADTDLTLSNNTSSISNNTSIAPQENTQAIGILDDFNRANGPIGSNWTNRTGTFNVVSNTARGGATAIATFNGKTSSIVEADVSTTGTALDYAGLVLNYSAVDNTIFIKVQNQDGDALFEKGACYKSNNGGGFGLSFFDLTQPFTSAHMRVELSGTTVTIKLTNIDSNTKPPQTYTCTGAPVTGGNGIGINSYQNTASIDNFAADVPPNWTYCFKDTLYTTEYRISLDTPENAVRGQAIATGSEFPAPITGYYNPAAGTLSFSMGYLSSNATRHYFLNNISGMKGYSWGVLDSSSFYDNPHAITLVSCPVNSPVPAEGETGAPK